MRAPWCALTVSGQGGAFGSLAAAALRAGASADSGILSRHQKFFCKNVFHTKATPFMGRTIFGQVFVRGGMSNFQNPKVPPTGGSHLPHAHPSSFEMRCTVPVPMPSDLATSKIPTDR